MAFLPFTLGRPLRGVMVKSQVRVTSVSPANGSYLGGETVTITGAGFQPGGGSALFGGALGTSFTYLSPTTATVVTPPGTMGSAVDLRVENAAGESGLLLAGYTYSPVMFSVLRNGPSATQIAAGTLKTDQGVTIVCTRAASVYCPNGVAATPLTLLSANQIAVTPNGFRTEPAATNSLLWGRDWTNAAWVAVNIAAAKTSTSVDGLANTASTLTATALNGTILQTLTLASATRASSLWIRRRTGTGTISVTRDGITWTDVTSLVSATWARLTPAVVSQLSSALLNPAIGLRLGTSGDAVDVDLAGDEVGAFATSEIATTSAAVTRPVDQLGVSITGGLPTPGLAGISISIDFYAPFSNGINNQWFFDSGGTQPGVQIAMQGNNTLYAGVADVLSGSSGFQSSSLGAWLANAKQHALYTQAGAVSNFYFNGAAAGTKSNTLLLLTGGNIGMTTMVLGAQSGSPQANQGGCSMNKLVIANGVGGTV